jgi:hypothetical protein
VLYLPTGSPTVKIEKSDENIHPNAPRRLVSAWRKAGRSDRKLAELRGVNHFYVSQLVHRGIEPDDKTEHQQDIRAKLFLRRKKRRAKVQRAPKLPKWLNQSEDALQWFSKQRETVKRMARDTTRSIAKAKKEANNK